MTLLRPRIGPHPEPPHGGCVRRRAALLVALMVGSGLPAGTARAEEPALDADRVPFDPAKVTASLEADRTEWLLGEPCLVHLRIENGNPGPVKLRLFRPTDIEVTAVPEDGGASFPAFVETGKSGSGPGWHPAVLPETPWYHSIPVHGAWRIPRPGWWTVRVRVCTGWRSPWDSTHVTAETRLHFVAPEGQRVRRLVEAGLGDPPVELRWSGKTEPGPDPAALASPPFVGALEERARAGVLAAIVPLELVETAEASRALVRLLDPPGTPLAREAAAALARRIPDREGARGIPYWRNQPFLEPPPARARALAEAWLPELAAPLRAYARSVLETGGREGLGDAAFLLRCQGLPEDVPALLRAADRELPGAALPRSPADSWRAVDSRLQALGGAMAVLVRRGAAVPERPATPAAHLLFLRALRERPAFRPPGWVERLDALLRESHATLRWEAVKAIPVPIPPRLRASLDGILRDPGSGRAAAVAVAALAAEAGEATLLPGILEALESTRDPEAVEPLVSHALRLGPELPVLRILVARLDEGEVGKEALGEIRDLVKGRRSMFCGWHGDSREYLPRLKVRWTRLLERHGGEFERSGLPLLGDPRLTRDLFPPGFHYGFEAGERIVPPEPEDE